MRTVQESIQERCLKKLEYQQDKLATKNNLTQLQAYIAIEWNCTHHVQWRVAPIQPKHHEVLCLTSLVLVFKPRFFLLPEDPRHPNTELGILLRLLYRDWKKEMFEARKSSMCNPLCGKNEHYIIEQTPWKNQPFHFRQCSRLFGIVAVKLLVAIHTS